MVKSSIAIDLDGKNFRGIHMLDSIQKLLELINSHFAGIKIEQRENSLCLSNGKAKVEFYFKRFRADDEFCADEFKNHLCLSFDYSENWSGGGWTSVADENDLSSEVIEFVTEHLHIRQCFQYDTYEQLTLF